MTTKPNRAPTGLAKWWPFFVGLAVSYFAPRLNEYLLLFDPWGMRIVFPTVILTGLRGNGLSDEMMRTLPQAMLYAQFPCEGLAVVFMLSRGVKVSGAIGQVIAMHGLCIFVLWLITATAR